MWSLSSGEKYLNTFTQVLYLSKVVNFRGESGILLFQQRITAVCEVVSKFSLKSATYPTFLWHGCFSCLHHVCRINYFYMYFYMNCAGVTGRRWRGGEGGKSSGLLNEVEGCSWIYAAKACWLKLEKMSFDLVKYHKILIYRFNMHRHAFCIRKMCWLSLKMRHYAPVLVCFDRVFCGVALPKTA